MDWLQNKTTQFIALMGIIGTLAGFGYTGATYVNRIENLETKARQARLEIYPSLSWPCVAILGQRRVLIDAAIWSWHRAASSPDVV